MKGRWNSENRGIRRQHIYFLRTSIRERLFDVSFMQGGSAFRDFVDALCKLHSVALMSVQVQAQGVLDVEEDNIPSASANATSLVTPHTKQVRG